MKTNKWNDLESFHKSIITSVFYSLVLIVVGLILLIVNTSWIYGIIIGIITMYVSYFLVWILWYKIKLTKSFMTKWTPILLLVIRTTLFLIIFMMVSFWINPSLASDGLIGLERFLTPINTIGLLLGYTVTIPSYLTVGLIDLIFDMKKNKKEGNK